MQNIESMNKLQNLILARYILSRLFALGTQVQVSGLNFSTGEAYIKFNPREADAALLAALAGGVA